MHRIIIYGNGWIASHFKDALDNYPTKLNYLVSDLRINNLEDLKRDLDTNHPTHVICCIGHSHEPGIAGIDCLEGKLKANLYSNMMVPLTIITECSLRDIHVTYIGTGCIYSRDEIISEPVKEEESPNFFGSEYSILKGALDTYIRNFFEDKILNLRIRMPISKKKSDYELITKLLRYDKISMDVNSVSYLDELIPIAIKMLLNKEKGTFNFVNSGCISGEMIKPGSIVGFKELGLKAERSNILLDNSKLLKKYNVRNIQECLPEVLEVHKRQKN